MSHDAWPLAVRGEVRSLLPLVLLLFQGALAAKQVPEPASGGPGLEETTFTVTFDPEAPAATRRASGFLSLINSSTPDPPTELVQPLAPRLWKNAYDTNYERITTEFECADVISTLGEHWGMPGTSPPPWLDDGAPDWSTWRLFCRQRALLYLNQGFNPVWNVWNEPDGASRWWHGAIGYSRLAETYQHAYEAIQQVYLAHPSYGPSDLVVAAPGFADWGNAYAFHSGFNYWTGAPLEPGFDGFLQYCADNAVECHVVMWHEFWEDHVFYIPTKAAILRALVDEFMLAQPAINVQRFYVDELIHANYPYNRNYHLSPGHVATVLSLVESAGIDGAVRAVWGDRYGFSGNINHSVCGLLDVQFCENPPGTPVLWPPPSACYVEPYAPRSQYWVHWYYAQFQGPVASVVASYPAQAGFGTYDPGQERYQVLLGYSLSYGYDARGVATYGFGTTCTRVDLSGLPLFAKTRFGSAQLTLLEIPPSGLDPLPAPTTLVAQQRVVFKDGALSWTLPRMERGHAYVLQLEQPRPLFVAEAPAPR